MRCHLDLMNNKKFYFFWIGVLTFLAGAINICAIELLGLTITHSTGNLTKAAILLASGDFRAFIEIFSIIILFFLGATIAGYLYFEKKSDITYYDAILPIMFGIVILISLNATTKTITLLRIISLGMGIQNGIYIRVRGVLIRTTHMSGYLTDAGFCLGSLLHGNHDFAWKLVFYLASIFTFFIGGFTSYLLIQRIGLDALQIVAILYGIDGLVVGTKIFKDNKGVRLKRKMPNS